MQLRLQPLIVKHWMNIYVYSMSKRRPYTLKQRAESQEATRQKIVEAAMQLHEELGPRATSVCAIADRAGVQRLTVYRHFPTEKDVLEACSSHWLSLNPPPDAALWASERTATDRARTALSAFYGYYAKTRAMWSRVLADAHAMPALEDPLSGYVALIAATADDLAVAFGRQGRGARLKATLQHVLAFPTWADLDERGVSDKEKVALALAWVDGVLTHRSERVIRATAAVSV
jgi:AcrR family transcriptional regulator